MRRKKQTRWAAWLVLAACMAFFTVTAFAAQTEQAPTGDEVAYYELIHYNPDGSVKDRMILPGGARADISTYSLYIQNVTASLNLSGNKATVSGSATLKSGADATLTVFLNQSNKGAEDWSEYNSWGNTFSVANTVKSLSKVDYLARGYDYQTVAECSAGSETLRAYSVTRTY